MRATSRSVVSAYTTGSERLQGKDLHRRGRRFGLAADSRREPEGPCSRWSGSPLVSPRQDAVRANVNRSSATGARRVRAASSHPRFPRSPGRSGHGHGIGSEPDSPHKSAWPWPPRMRAAPLTSSGKNIATGCPRQRACSCQFHSGVRGGGSVTARAGPASRARGRVDSTFAVRDM
ncbi:MAG: hypothetical protein JWR46_2623 [Mycobacterium sp.]|nr:hypothetical protein [Mycobacterium sp.]